jgi:hypothetical protein
MHGMSVAGIFRKLFGERDSAADPEPRVAIRSGTLVREVKSREIKSRDIKEPREVNANPWHAVSVLPCAGACHAAQEAFGLRYLSKTAPTLPLVGCDVAACTCRYRHHDDRRQAPRRAGDIWSFGGSFKGPERREKRGRRASDHA